MKSFIATLLFLCAAALCITVTAAVPKAKTKLQDFHKIQKRQVSQSTVCFADLVPDACTNGRLQEAVDTNNQCNQTSSNQELQDFCRRNSDGLFCGGEAQLLAEKFQVDSSTTCDVSRQDCSPACRNLILDARNRLGCCINIFNDSTSSVPRQYSNSLWSSCGVSRVTQQCGQSIINLRTVPVDPTCDSATFLERTQSINCRRDYVNDLRDALSDVEECEDILDALTLCNANRNRTYCILLSLPSNFSEASTNCADTSTCDPSCIRTLTNITNTAGCCFMDRYNTTYEYGWLGYEFWSRCGLESPGFCEEYLNDAAVILKASSTAITFAVTAAILLLRTAMI